MDSSSDVTTRSFGGHEKPEPARLCVGGCGFFGTAEKQGFCSKCYTSYFKDTNPTALIVCDGTQSNLDAEKELRDQSHDDDHPVVAAAKKDRCVQCRKKVGPLGFGCRCGGTFCGTHRYPDEHACGFDYKEAGKKAIQKENPVIKADKIVHF